MERWRSFFNKAGADVWTIIEQAIVLAATDYPGEFKEKRCDIAETLFARRPIHRDTEATRLSASVVTNCTNRMEADEPRDDEHGSEHAKKPVRHDAEQRRTDFCSAEPLNDDSDDHASIMTVVHGIKETLNDSLQSDAAVLGALRTLESLHISVDVLKATEIGKQVNNLRKHSCKDVRFLAKGLVRQWKELVDDWVNSAGIAATDPLGESGGRATSERDDVEQGLSSTPLDERIHLSARMPAEMPQLCYYDMKSRNNYLEFPEERGSSSRAELSGLDRAERLERKPQLNGRGGAGSEILKDERGIDHVGRLSGTNSSFGGLGPGRPIVDVSKGKGNGLAGNVGIGKPSDEVLYVSKHQGDNSSQKNRNSKLPTLNQQRSMCVDGVQLEDKLEAPNKRKLQEGYTQAENAKKQRTAQLMDLSDLPKGGLARAKMAVPSLAAQSSHWNQNRK